MKYLVFGICITIWMVMSFLLVLSLIGNIVFVLGDTSWNDIPSKLFKILD